MRAIACLFAFVCLAGPVAAQDLGARLMESLQMPRLFEQMSREALRNGQSVDADFLGGEGGDVFHETIARLNDPERLLETYETRLMQELDDTQVEALLIFFESDLGQRIVDLELDAREAMHDPDIEAMVRERVQQTGARELVLRMIEHGDLIERNVVDGLGSLRAFYEGRREGGASDLSKSDIDDLLAGSEDAIRFDTQSWLSGYLTLAYSPLSDADLETYVRLWETETGEAYDAAMFKVFAEIFEEVGFATGQLVARLSLVDEI